MPESFDVFLSHNSKDKSLVREIALRLEQEYRLSAWLDEKDLRPGLPFQEGLEEAMQVTRSAAVFVGAYGLGSWQRPEVRACLSQMVQRGQPVIPVLLPGAPEKPDIGLFLKDNTWVAFREGISEKELARLVWGITGERPDRSKPATLSAAPEVAVTVKKGLAEAPQAVAKEKSTRRTRALLSVIASTGLLTVLGTAAYLSDFNFSRFVEPRSRPPREPAPAVAVSRPCRFGEEKTMDGIEYVRICSGTFTMGSGENEPLANLDEKPAHQVTLSEFWLGRTEITNEQYNRFRTGYYEPLTVPVVDVSWPEAKAACEFFGGRLPTEAEWEYAARAGSRTTWSFGDDERVLGEYAWYGQGPSFLPEPVGMKRANAWGLHDMHGNVSEWVADWYGSYPRRPVIDPTGPAEGKFRVTRGGFSFNSAEYLRSAARDPAQPEHGDRGGIGFRCARDASDSL